MKNLRIRTAEARDLPELLRFEQGVVNAEREFDPTLKRTEVRYYDLDHMLSADHIELAVAELDGQLIGSGYARIETSDLFLRHGQHAYLGFMYVLPDFRGHGVVREVLHHLKQWAKARGITELRLEVYYLNESAIRAYEKAGFIKHMIEMRSEA